jgi:hypothetical protein
MCSACIDQTGTTCWSDDFVELVETAHLWVVKTSRTDKNFSSAWCVSLLIRDSLLQPEVTPIHGLGLRRKLAGAVLMGQLRVDSDRQSCRRLSCNGVTMVQSAESRKGVNLASHQRTHRCWPTRRRVLRESEVRPIFMVIAHILSHQPLEVLLIQDDHVVQQVSSATPDPALRDTVLPRTAKGSAGGVASQFSHRRNHIRSEL